MEHDAVIASDELYRDPVFGQLNSFHILTTIDFNIIGSSTPRPPVLFSSSSSTDVIKQFLFSHSPLCFITNLDFLNKLCWIFSQHF